MIARIKKVCIAGLLIAFAVLVLNVRVATGVFGGDTLVGITIPVDTVERGDYVCAGRIMKVVGEPGDLLQCEGGVLKCNGEIIATNAKVTPRELREFCLWDGKSLEYTSGEFIRFIPLNERASIMILTVAALSVMICAVLR